jgi:MFS family permease
LFFWVKEARHKLQTAKIKLSLSLKSFPPELKMFLLGLCIFSLGNSSDSFLILRAKNLGLSLLLVISAYILYNIIYALSSTPAGIISDRIGTKKVFIVGIIIFALCYLGFALDKNGIFIWPLFAIYGFYIGLTDGVSKAMVGALVGKETSGTAYGIMNTITGGFTLFASVIGGFLWTLVAPSATFYFAVICALASVPIFLLIKPRISRGA